MFANFISFYTLFAKLNLDKLGYKGLFFLFFLNIFSIQFGYAQPCKINGQPQTFINKCIEITSILVDACGTPEGENEILTFKVGKNKINTVDISMKWSNNSFQGICQNTTTDSIVERINRTIISCGYLKQPKNGEIPANANVFFFTSTSFKVGSNSFTNIADTAYAIFQCGGNTSGHFANYASGGGSRTNILYIAGYCNDTVTYDRGSLLTSSGSVGAQDGGLVTFKENGDASYANNGCNAPYIVVSAKAINLGKDTMCADDTAFIEAQDKNERCFVWRSAHGKFSDTVSKTPSFIPYKNFRKYVLKLYAWGGCNIALIDSIVLVVNQSGILNIKLDSQLCDKKVNIKSNFTSGVIWQSSGFGNFVRVNDSITAYNFNQLKDTNPIQIIASVKDNCGNNQQDTVSIAKPLDNSYIKLGNDTILCQGESLQLNAITNTTKIGWKHNGSGTIISPNVISINYTPSNSDTKVKVWVTSQDICSNAIDSLLLTITKFNALRPIFSDTVVCVNSNPIVLTPDIYLGTFSGNGVVGYNFIPNTIGIFSITYQAILGRCSAKAIKTIIVKDKPNADFNISPSNNLPIAETFVCESIQKNNLSHNWNAYTSNSVLDEIRFKPGIAGNYNVQHIVKDTTTGCMDTAILSVTVYGEEQIVIPNAFSPNNDSINDFFYLESTQLLEINLFVYNRWGELIFKTNDLKGKWDGTYKGQDCSNGTYFYLVNCMGISKKKYTFKGVISLIR